jgi:hypothetical protein
MLAATLIITGQDSPTLVELTKEADRIRSGQPEVWQNYVAEKERAFSEHRELTSGWRKRGMPPRLDFQPLKLPLAFLVVEVQQANDSDVGAALLEAISSTSDNRRIKVLLALHAKFGDSLEGDWDRLLATAADREWAVEQIAKLTRNDSILRTSSLLFYLLSRFGGDLPKDTQLAAYEFVRSRWNKGPGNGDGERYWDVLLRIDVERARKEIIPYFGNKEEIYDGYIVEVLGQHAGPSPEVARAVKRWLRFVDEQEDHWFATEMRILLLKSDPNGELQSTVQQIDKEIARQKARNETAGPLTGDLDRLITAIIAINSESAVQPLLRYVNNQQVSDLTQIEIMEWLAARRYEQMPSICARWLAEHPNIQSWLRNTAEQKWGEYGRQVLEEADRINKKQ